MAWRLWELTDKEKKIVNERMYMFKHKYGFDGITAFRYALNWIFMSKGFASFANACKSATEAMTKLCIALSGQIKQISNDLCEVKEMTAKAISCEIKAIKG